MVFWASCQGLINKASLHLKLIPSSEMADKRYNFAKCYSLAQRYGHEPICVTE